MRKLKIAGRAVSPLAIIGVFIAIAAIVSAGSIMTQQKLFGVDVTNPTEGIQVSTFTWTNGAGTPLPSTPTLGVLYQFGVNAKSFGSYTDVTGTITVEKTSGTAMKASDVTVRVYYGATPETSTWHSVTLNVVGSSGTVDITSPVVGVGLEMNFYVDITYNSVGHYNVYASATGTDA